VDATIDENLTLEQMADSVNLSVAHFSQMFRKSTGHSPHQFVLRHRIERAKEILGSADMRVLHVAVACGFKKHRSTLPECFVRCAESALPSIARKVLC
jgi:AraC family transcriptional regulator